MSTITFSGYVRTEPELRKAGTNDFLSFRVPVKTGWGDREVTTWYSISHFRGVAALAKLIQKGTYVTVTGEFTAREYQKDGVTKYSMDVNSDRITLGPKTGDTPPAPAGNVGGGARQVDDEIPF
jgi:single-stranded DNA-binding protein